MQLFIRSWNVFYGLMSRLVSLFERRNPEALLEREQERFRTFVREFNQGLVTHATLSERLKSKISADEGRLKQATARLHACLKAGDQKLAGRYALELKQIEEQLVENRKKLEQSEARYQQLVEARDTAITEARGKIELLRFQIGDLKVNRAMADLETMAASMMGRLGDPGDGMNRLSEMVAEENDKARARSKVAGGASLDVDFAARAAERDYLEAQALEEFKTRHASAQPLSLPDYSASPAFDPPKKTTH